MITLVVNGLVSLIKQIEPPKRLIPVLALLAGTGVSYLYSDISKAATIDGIIAGLSAMGLYSGAKTMRQGDKGSEK